MGHKTIGVLEHASLGLQHRPDRRGESSLFKTVRQPPILDDCGDWGGRVVQVVKRIHKDIVHDDIEKRHRFDSFQAELTLNVSPVGLLLEEVHHLFVGDQEVLGLLVGEQEDVDEDLSPGIGEPLPRARVQEQVSER